MIDGEHTITTGPVLPKAMTVGYLTLYSDGRYAIQGTFEDMLSSQHSIVRAFGAALRDHYEAGRKGIPAPTSGQWR